MDIITVAGNTPESVAFNFYDREVILGMALSTFYIIVAVMEYFSCCTINQCIPHMAERADVWIMLRH